jgi:outer membrane immunogenic protein
MGASMRHSLIAPLLAASLVLGWGVAASAADMILKAPPPVAAPLYDWTGFYGGVDVGYSWGGSHATTYSSALATTYTESIPHRGWEASIEGGYCWQQSPTTPYVACLEARYDFPREHSGTNTSTTIPLTTTTNTTHVDPFLIGPHLGFLTDQNHTMVYAAGGLAVGEVGGSSIGTGVGGTSTATPGNKTTTGWFLGAGIEQMIDQHWSVKAEYDYVRFSGNGAVAPYTGTEYALLTGSGSTASLGGHAYDNIFTAGIDYHLGTH